MFECLGIACRHVRMKGKRFNPKVNNPIQIDWSHEKNPRYFLNLTAWDFRHKGGEGEIKSKGISCFPTWWISNYYFPPLLIQTRHKWYKAQYQYNSVNDSVYLIVYLPAE